MRDAVSAAADTTAPAEGRWVHSEMETFYAGELPSWREPCEVVIRGGQIAVHHRDPALGAITFVEREAESGHYTLQAANGARLSLHRFAGSNRLEGYWADRGNRGMWLVTLSDDPEDKIG